MTSPCDNGLHVSECAACLSAVNEAVRGRRADGLILVSEKRLKNLMREMALLANQMNDRAELLREPLPIKEEP